MKAGGEKRCFQNHAGTFPLLHKVVVSPLSHHTKHKVEHCTEGLGFSPLWEPRGTRIPVSP